MRKILRFTLALLWVSAAVVLGSSAAVGAEPETADCPVVEVVVVSSEAPIGLLLPADGLVIRAETDGWCFLLDVSEQPAEQPNESPGWLPVVFGSVIVFILVIGVIGLMREFGGASAEVRNGNDAYSNRIRTRLELSDSQQHREGDNDSEPDAR